MIKFPESTGDYLLRELQKPFSVPEKQAPPRPRVLVVDDDADFTMMISEKLEHAGCSVAVAHDSNEAIKKMMDAIRFKHVLVDLNFPTGDNGVEIMHKIMAIDPTIPVTIFSGFMTPEMMEIAHQRGYNVINKDADIESLKALITRAT